MKRTFLLLFLLLLLIFALPTLAHAAIIDSGSCGGSASYTLTDAGLLTITGSGTMTSAPWDNDLVITVKISSGITNIANEAFYEAHDLESVSIPGSVERIGVSAFEGCDSLLTVNIPYGVKMICDRAFYESGITELKIMNSITEIGAEAFYNCGNLASISSGTSTSELTKIGESAFQYCTSLQSVTLGNKLKTIGGYAFADCTALMSFTIPSNVTTIGYYAFQNDGGLRTITIPNTVTSLGESAFEGCYCLETVKLSSNLTSIKTSTFFGCALASITIPNKVTSIGMSAFCECINLKNVNFGSGVTRIEDNAFGHCTGLTSITIPSTVTAIEDNAFTDCTDLVSITIPKSVTSMGVGVFYNNNSDLVIKCYLNSTALAYAMDNNIQYQLLDPKPVITTQPASVSVNEGQTATFKVVANYADSYQWYYRTSSYGTWTAVKKNGTAATYTLTTEARHNGYQYRCIISNAVGATSSATATLTVNAKPIITTQPKSVTVNEGKTATFKVVATGADSYQWYYRTSSTGSWTAVKNNGTTATYTLTTAARHNGYQYRCLVKNSAGSVYSNTVTLTVNAKPVITTQPKSVTVNAGKTATFKVVATGAASYQWYYLKPGESTWNAVSNNGTSATYTLTTQARHNGYQYKCKVSNSVGYVWSGIAKLTVNAKPVITTQPANVSVVAGKTATFKVVATGADSYQWYYQKPGESTWIAVSNNGTSATYTLTTAARHNGYKYKCEVKNTVGTTTSNVVTLTVK